MACYHPLFAWRAPPHLVHRSGKRKAIVFNDPCDDRFDRVIIPCGQCIGCRLERSRQWAIRCVHEASLHESNCFLTLTYNDENLPSNGSLNLEDIQLFLKRLRRHVEPVKIRFFQCGEYGEQYQRPHHHCIIFGYDFPDKELIGRNLGNSVYQSATLDRLWGKGFCSIGDVSFESAAYVARYVLKKVTGKEADSHYGDRKPDFITMSRRPGLAADWFNKFEGDVYPKDFLTIRNGLKCHPPKFYDRLYERNHGSNELAKIVEKRKEKASLLPEPYSPDLQDRYKRLIDQEAYRETVTKLLKRKI